MFMFDINIYIGKNKLLLAKIQNSCFMDSVYMQIFTYLILVEMGSWKAVYFNFKFLWNILKKSFN